jgi:predicted TIM-barrel fold metal-dependent hydrolase
MRYMNLIHEVQRSLSDIVLGGVLERFPGLQIVSAESDTGWLPHFMQRLDRAQEKFGVMLGNRLSMQPSDYVRRQVWATFLDDRVGASAFETHGQDTFMWGSDFPHSDSTFPNSRKVIDENLAGVPEAIARKVVCDNAARLYGIEL